MAIYEPIQRLNFLWIKSVEKGYIRVTLKVYLDLNEHIKDLTGPVPMPADKHAKVNLEVVGSADGNGSYLFTKKYLIHLFNNIDSLSDFTTNLDGVGEYLVTSKIMKGGKVVSKVTNVIEDDEDIEVED